MELNYTSLINAENILSMLNTANKFWVVWKDRKQKHIWYNQSGVINAVCRWTAPYPCIITHSQAGCLLKRVPRRSVCALNHAVYKQGQGHYPHCVMQHCTFIRSHMQGGNLWLFPSKCHITYFSCCVVGASATLFSMHANIVAQYIICTAQQNKSQISQKQWSRWLNSDATLSNSELQAWSLLEVIESLPVPLWTKDTILLLGWCLSMTCPALNFLWPSVWMSCPRGAGLLLQTCMSLRALASSFH